MIMTKVPEAKFWTAIKQAGLHWLSMFFGLVCLGFCLLLLVLLGGTAWKIWEAVAAAIGSTRPGRFLAFLFLALVTAGSFATFGGFLCRSVTRDFLRKNTTLSFKQKDSIEGNAFVVGALVPAGFYLFICFKGWLEGKI